MICNVCSEKLGDPIYESDSLKGITSLCELYEAQVKIWLCKNCGHLRGQNLNDVEQFYDSEYKISIDHVDEDQIYDVLDGKIVYRTEHQALTFLKLMDLQENAVLLDYGSAKGSTPRRLSTFRKDLNIFLFDVSKMYCSYWKDFVSDSNTAVYFTPSEWNAKFDVVTSFFALEHIPNPIETVKHVYQLLKPGAVYYGVVPNVFTNVADFVVVDHVNHFSESSLFRLLRSNGFSDIMIDSECHRGALVFRAIKDGICCEEPDVNVIVERGYKLAKYWSSVNHNIIDNEKVVAGGPLAIYGSGFYGIYIASSLLHLEHLVCFLDQSPYRQGKEILGKKILAPSDLPENVKYLYVGLNPKIARETINNMLWTKHPNLSFLFIDKDLP